MKRSLLPLLALVLCSASPSLEIYNATTPERAAECRAAGFNALVVRNRDQLDLCARYGFRGVFSGIPHGHDGFDPEAVKAAVEAVRDHPALAGYVVIDEPDLRPWAAPPELVSELADAVREADPEHPVAATFSGFLGARALTAYVPGVDILRLDPYPFFYDRPMTWAMEVVDAGRAATGDRKPVTLIQQAWSSSRAFPDPDYDRCLSWLGLIHGVDSFSHYAYAFGDRGKPQTLPEHEPAFWAGLKANTAALANLGELSDPPADTNLRWASFGGRIQARLFERQGDLIWLACNPTAVTDSVTILFPDPEGEMALFENGQPLTRQAESGDVLRLGPYQTLTARCAGATPFRPTRPLLPVTLEVQNHERSSAWVDVIVRNHGERLEDVTLSVEPSPAEDSAPTRTDLPGGRSVARVVYAEPARRADGTPFPYLEIRLTDADGREITRTRSDEEGTTITGKDITAAVRVVETRDDKVLIEASLMLPTVANLRLATAECRFGRWATHTEITPRLGVFSYTFEKKIPDTPAASFLPGSVRFQITDNSGSREISVPFIVPVQPPVRLATTDPARLMPGVGNEVSFVVETAAPLLPGGNLNLELPPGWEMEQAQASDAGDSSTTRNAAFAITPPTQFGRFEGVLTYQVDRNRSWSWPVPLDVEMVALRIDSSTEGVVIADPSTTRSYRLESGEPEDLAATVRPSWNDGGLQLICTVTDGRHLPNTSTPGVWKGDSIQVSLLVGPNRGRTPEAGDPGFANFGFSWDAAKGRMLTDVGFVPEGIEREEVLAALEASGQRDGDRTLYRIRIPWEILGASPAGGDTGWLSVLVNGYDQDALDDRKWLEFGGGIVAGTNPTHYAPLRFLAGEQN